MNVLETFLSAKIYAQLKFPRFLLQFLMFREYIDL